MKWFEKCALDRMVMNAVIIAEASSTFAKFDDASSVFKGLELNYEDISELAAHHAGRAHVIYRRNGGLRDRVLPDFLVGAHAKLSGYRVLTRDGTRYRTYFPEVEVIAPDTHP